MIIGTNFKLSSAKFLDDRQLCKDYATLIANAEGIIYPPGFEVFCEYENKYYQYVSDTNGGYIWEERKSGVSDGTSASIKDDTISEEYTWSSAHIDSMRIDLETLITQANDYVDEIDERMLYIEGKFQWFEYFDGSYESLKDKPTIPTKISELEDDNEIMIKLEGKVDIEEGKTLIDVQELNRLSNIEQYDDTEIKNRLLTVEVNSHTHNNGYIIDSITEEMVNQWNEMGGGVEDYNYLINKPIIRIGEDPDLVLNVNDLNNKGVYVVNGIIDGERFAEELCATQLNDSNTMITLIMLNSMKKVVLQRDEEIEEEWHIIKVENYGIDKNNAKIIDTLTIGEDKIILDKEGNGWYGGKVSQEGIPTEDKDLVTKGYVDNKFATNERVSAIEKENARRDVIIEALANGRRRTVETDGNDVDLIFSTEKDKVWIDKIEGETLVNVCDQEEPIAITKSYTVEGTNHVPLQGEYDGKARPVVYGNTLVNHNVEYDKSIIIGERIDNRQGTEILNFEGTPNCEIKVDIDGHTALNLSTKKEDILCKSFDSASGNEINLVAEENSVSDLVIQGNTMVNLANIRVTNFHWGDRILLQELKPNTIYTFVVNISNPTIDSKYMIGILDKNNNNAWSCVNDSLALGNTIFTMITNNTPSSILRMSCSVVEAYADFDIMIFEGDLTQTPELIPTEYVEGLQSTFEDKLIPYSIYNGDNLTSITETQYQLPLTVKVGKTYTITTTANVGTTENHKYQYGVYSADGLTNYLEYESCSPTQTFVCDKANILFKVRMYPSYSGDDYSFVLDEVKDKFLIVEGDWSSRLDLLTEEYFGKYRVDMNSVGKNLLNINKYPFKEGYELKNSDTRYNGQGEVTSRTEMFSVKPNTTYTYSVDITASTNVGSVELFVILYEEDNIPNTTDIMSTSFIPTMEVARKSITFTTPNVNGLVCELRVDNNFSTDGNESIVSFANIQLEEGTQATEYEPYYGSSKTVYLNSPLLNGDELLTKDGKLYHYHKMGKVVLDGSEDWTHYANGDITNVFCLKTLKGKLAEGINLYCDKFLSRFGSWNVDSRQEGVQVDADIALVIQIDNSKLSTTDVNGFKQWLSENPTTVVYELAEPWYEPIGAYGKIVLDGSGDENWFAFNESSEAISYAGIQIPNMKVGYTTKIICDKFETLSNGINYDQTYTKEQCYPYQITSSPGVGIIYFHVFNSKLSSHTKEGWIQWLQQNPVTVIYELAEPQYIDEDMRFNIASTSTIEYQSSVPMANTQFLPYRNELPLLESSTQYRVTFDCDVEGLELMVSLGGTSQTITSKLHNELSFITPSLQTDGKLTIDGYGIAKIDNVLITSGSMEYKYFEGLKSGFEDGYIPQSIIDLTNVTISDGTAINLPVTNIKPNTKYTIIDETLKGKYMAIRFKDNNKDTSTDSSILSDTILDYVPFSGLYVITTYNETYDFSNVVLRIYNNFGMNNTTIDFSNMIILEGDWSENLPTSDDVINNPNKYKANIKIQNPNAPIFGKGGRL